MLLCRPIVQPECCQSLCHRALLALCQRPKPQRASIVPCHPSGKTYSRLYTMICKVRTGKCGAVVLPDTFPSQCVPITGAPLSIAHCLPAQRQAGGGVPRRPGGPQHPPAGGAPLWIRGGAEGGAGPYKCCLYRSALLGQTHFFADPSVALHCTPLKQHFHPADNPQT